MGIICNKNRNIEQRIVSGFLIRVSKNENSAQWKNRILDRNLQNRVHPAGGGEGGFRVSYKL